MAKCQLVQVLKSIKRLQQSHSNDLQHIYNLNHEIEYGKSKILEYIILNKTKLLRKIKRKLKQLRISRQRYLKKIKKFRKKLRTKLRVKLRIEAKLEKILLLRAKRRECFRKRMLLKRLVREKRLMRLKQMAELRESDRKRYVIELKAERRRKKLLKKRSKRQNPVLKRLKYKIRKTKKRGALLEEKICSLRSSIEGFQKKADLLRKNAKFLNVKASHIKKELKNSGLVKKIEAKSSKVSSEISSEALKKSSKSSKLSIKSLPTKKVKISQKKSSKMSVRSLMSKKSVRLGSFKDTAAGKRKSKASLSAPSNRFVPLNALMAKSFPISISRHKKSKKEPKPIGDMRHSQAKGKFPHKRNGRNGSSTSTTSPIGNTTSTASESGRKSSLKKSFPKRGRHKRKLLQGAGDTSAEISSYIDDISSLTSDTSTQVYKRGNTNKQLLSKKPTVNLDNLRKSLRKSKIKRRHIKGVFKPIDRYTLRSILLPDSSKDMLKMPRHSTSKPTYFEPVTASSESEIKPLVYNENYYKNLVRTQTQSIRNLIKAERKLKRLQKQKNLEEAERRAKEQIEQEARKRRFSLNNHDKELERLVEAGLKSQFNLFDVIPDETPVINEDILKLSERGERINIRDLVPTSRIFDWNAKSSSPPESARPSTSRKGAKQDGKSKKKQRRRTFAVRRHKKKEKQDILQDSNELDEELGSVVQVSKFWDFNEEIKQQQPVAEESKEVIEDKIYPLDLKKKKKISVRSLLSKKSVRLGSIKDTAAEERKSKASLSAPSNRFIPVNALMGKKFPISILRGKKGQKGPRPTGDTRHSQAKGKLSHKRKGRKGRSTSTTSNTGNTTSTASESGRKSSLKKSLAKRDRHKRKLQQGAADTSEEISSYRDDISSLNSGNINKQLLSKKPAVNLDNLRKSLRKPKIKRRHIKGVFKPIDRYTLRSIILPDGSKDMLKMPRHSTSKPTYSEPETVPSESEIKPLVYNENYYKNLVRTQTQSIRNLIKAERKLKRLQKQKELEEAERRSKEQREQEVRKRRFSLNDHDKELERLVEVGLKSQFNLFDVIPDETPVINEDILKLAERGERINIRDLVPTSRIFDCNAKSSSPAESARSSTSRKGAKQDGKSKKKQRRRTFAVRRHKKKGKQDILQDSNESDEELDSVVEVRKFWDFNEELKQQQPVAEKSKEVIQDANKTTLDLNKKKDTKGITSKLLKEQQIAVPNNESEMVVVCSACNMTNMEPAGPCCKFKPKKMKAEM